MFCGQEFFHQFHHLPDLQVRTRFDRPPAAHQLEQLVQEILLTLNRLQQIAIGCRNNYLLDMIFKMASAGSPPHSSRAASASSGVTPSCSPCLTLSDP